MTPKVCVIQRLRVDSGEFDIFTAELRPLFPETHLLEISFLPGPFARW